MNSPDRSMVIAECDSFSNVPSSPAATASATPTTAASHKKPKKRSKTRVKYWSLPTVSSGTFDPRFLTERQQLQYLAQKSKGVGDDALEVSPLRLDRLKLEEKRMMGMMAEGSSGHHSHSNSQPGQNHHQQQQQRLHSPLVPKRTAPERSTKRTGPMPMTGKESPNEKQVKAKEGVKSVGKENNQSQLKPPVANRNKRVKTAEPTELAQSKTPSIDAKSRTAKKPVDSSTNSHQTPLKPDSASTRSRKPPQSSASAHLTSSPIAVNSPSLNSRRAASVAGNSARNSIVQHQVHERSLLQELSKSVMEEERSNVKVEGEVVVIEEPEPEQAQTKEPQQVQAQEDAVVVSPEAVMVPVKEEAKKDAVTKASAAVKKLSTAIMESAAVKQQPTTTAKESTSVKKLSAAPMQQLPSFTNAVQTLLDYTKSIRSRHLDALLEAMSRRTGMSPREVQKKRLEIERKYQQ